MQHKEPKLLKAEKLIFGGQALSHYEGSTVMLWNALPGELVEVKEIKKRKGVKNAWANSIVEPSQHRIEPVESHFGSCSPWQIMNYEYENQQKLAIAKETYEYIGKIDVEEIEIKIVSPQQRLRYRNKIEFSFFVDNESGEIDLAFFNRGTKQKAPIQDCKLAEGPINDAARQIIDWIRSTKLTNRNLKSLIVRSNSKGEVIAALFIKDKIELDLPQLPENILGFELIYSTHKSPASVVTEILKSTGQDYLEEDILDTKLRYGLHSFFQVYEEAFELALREIKKEVPTSRPLLDFYSGVGSIGLPLAKFVPAVMLVESNPEAVGFANKNIKLNSISNAKTINAPAEKLIDLIDAEHTLIVDPPRAGLHGDVVDRVLEVKPHKIIYLSCNISTQARDIEMLASVYNVESIKLFNLFPATPHIEGLVVLTKRR